MLPSLLNHLDLKPNPNWITDHTGIDAYAKAAPN